MFNVQDDRFDAPHEHRIKALARQMMRGEISREDYDLAILALDTWTETQHRAFLAGMTHYTGDTV